MNTNIRNSCKKIAGCLVSEYSELLDKRMLVLGQQLDFPLRRPVHGYLEVIEIKTPLKGETGFHSDRSHTQL